MYHMCSISCEFHLSRLYQYNNHISKQSSDNNMNQVEVRVASCSLSLNATAHYSVCLRIGKHVSEMSPEKQPNKGLILFNQTLRLTVNQSALQTNPKCSVAIYMRRENQERKIVGMVTIRVDQAKQPNAEMDTYKIQQSPDRNACIQAVMHIYRESPENPANTTAISSLSQIRDFHQILTSGNTPRNNQTRFKFSAGSGFGNQLNNKKRISEISIPSKVDSPPKQCKCQQYEATIQKLTRQVSDLKSKASHFQKMAESTASQKNGAASVISGIQENNNYLKEIVSIEQKKNLLSNRFISEILRVLDIPNQQIKIIKGELQLQHSNPFKPFSSMSPVSVKVSNSSQKKGTSQYGKESGQMENLQDKGKWQEKIRKEYESQIIKVSKQRDEFFQLSQDLFLQVNAQKQFKMELINQLKQKQINQMAYEEAVEKLKYEVQQSKKKGGKQDENDLTRQRARNDQLGQRIRELEASNKQLERKFIETFEGLKQFKKDSLAAKEEIINKDSEIEKLVRQKHTIQANYQQIKTLYEAANTNHSGTSVKTPIIDANLLRLLAKSIQGRKVHAQNQRNHHSFNISEEIIRKAKMEIDSSYSKLLNSNRSKQDILHQKRTISRIIDTYLFKT